MTWSAFVIYSLIAIAAAMTCAAESTKDTLSPRLFPMTVGDRWVYTDGKQDVTFAVLETEKAGEQTVFVVQRTIGDKAVEFRVAVEEDGVYIHQEGDKVFEPPLRQFAFFARTGDQWKWKGTTAGKAEAHHFENMGISKLKVPAGEFTTISVAQQNADKADHATFWLASAVGVVKLSGKVEGAVVFDWELKSFERKK
jgi:hypothetical protein